MPIYEFHCPECNCAFETLVLKRKDVEAVSSPDCGSAEVKRLISIFATGSGGRASGGACGSSRFR